MRKLILVAAVLAFAVPAQAHHARSHHARWHHAARYHHHYAVAAPQPDSVTIEGKDYKVCKGATTDDCVNPRQAGLGFGNRPTTTYQPDAAAQ